MVVARKAARVYVYRTVSNCPADERTSPYDKQLAHECADF